MVKLVFSELSVNQANFANSYWGTCQLMEISSSNLATRKSKCSLVSPKQAVHNFSSSFILGKIIIFEMIKICRLQKSATQGSYLQCLNVNWWISEKLTN